MVEFSNGTVGLNYHRWGICSSACKNGRKLGIPVYKSLKEPIIRRFGEEFYSALECAEDLLKNSKDTIAEIAHKVGFNDPLYFSKKYKAFFGYSPSENR